nr:LicD family protein [Lachnospiraceae bacterium]
MEIDSGFYESEVRDGFYVPSIMKRSWGATLGVLNEIDKICKRHGLRWWMDWGSLLGLVRHGGFTPWDDDIDISMLRKDYDLFLEYAKDELPEDYYIANIYTEFNFPEY